MPEIVVVTGASAGVRPSTMHVFVAYIRALQASARASIADVPPDMRQALR